MGEHSKRSPSQISRIIRCPGSTAFIKYLIDKGTIPAEETTDAADEGTMLHKQIELRVLDKPFSEELDAEQETAIDDGLGFLRELQQKHNLTWLQTEQRFSLEGYGIDDGDGTADIVAGSQNRSLHILDWKFGRGVPVFVESNEQLMDYLLGAAENLENLKSYDELWIHLAQPRLDYYGSYKCNIEELMGLINAIKNSIDNYDIVAGEKQCFWCRGKTRCKEYDELNQSRAITVFSANKSLAANEFSFEQMKKALEYESFFKKTFKAIKDEFQKMSGPQLASIGLKRVAGKSNRKFSSETKVVEYLCENYEELEDIYEPPKLLGPAGLEKKIKGLKKDPKFQKLIVKPLGAPTIVSVLDKRPEYTAPASIAFAQFKPEE